MRVSGFGYGDDSLENEISQVSTDFGFSSDVEQNLQSFRSVITFDLLLFDNTEDYLCYVEAVHMLQHQKIKHKCAFIDDADKFKDGIYKLNLTDHNFLIHTQRAKEYFFVIDNTEYPEALLDDSWEGPEDIPTDGSKDLYIELMIKTTFSSNNKYYFWTLMFAIILIILGVLLIMAMVCYCRQTWVYNRYVRERQDIKKELLKVKDTEYANFLLQESEVIKRKARESLQTIGKGGL